MMNLSTNFSLVLFRKWRKFIDQQLKLNLIKGLLFYTSIRILENILILGNI